MTEHRACHSHTQPGPAEPIPALSMQPRPAALSLPNHCCQCSPARLPCHCLQERILLAEGNDWRQSYFMPARADTSVVATRQWLDKFGGEVPTCEAGVAMPPAMTRQEALDRYSQHTASCTHCQKVGAVLCVCVRACVRACVCACARARTRVYAVVAAHAAGMRSHGLGH